MNVEEILASEEYWQERYASVLYQAVSDYMEANNLSEEKFAKEIGESKAFVKKILSGRANLKITQVIKISLAVGQAPFLSFIPLRRYIAVRKIWQKR